MALEILPSLSKAAKGSEEVSWPCAPPPGPLVLSPHPRGAGGSESAEDPGVTRVAPASSTLQHGHWKAGKDQQGFRFQAWHWVPWVQQSPPPQVCTPSFRVLPEDCSRNSKGVEEPSAHSSPPPASHHPQPHTAHHSARREPICAQSHLFLPTRTAGMLGRPHTQSPRVQALLQGNPAHGMWRPQRQQLAQL